ncbi:MAG: 2-oxoglutarate and iron-dependent oxygenase domain-containing protein, partial [Alphaproteobacteria bacterium]
MDIPSVNIAPFLDGENKSSVSDQVAASCRDIGFLMIRGHGLKNTILQNAFGLIRAFMDLPQAYKDRWHPKGPSRQRGYHGFATRGLATT